MAQPKWIPLRIPPSNLVGTVYPALAAKKLQEELIVISDDGGVYLGDHAWLILLARFETISTTGAPDLAARAAAIRAPGFQGGVRESASHLEVA